uniref:C-type lectin domain containing 11A n=1 Tax=Sinocyclocheilus grahami TaxID=75366 RepID=A0A672N2A9_SINGR
MTLIIFELLCALLYYIYDENDFVVPGCQKGRKIGYKCFLAYRAYENYTDASQKCQERGGRMAMPRDRKEQEALAEYVKSVFHGNWPVWLGINDERSEGLYLFEDTTHVTYFQWRKHFLSSQPDGGKRENFHSKGRYLVFLKSLFKNYNEHLDYSVGFRAL